MAFEEVDEHPGESPAIVWFRQDLRLTDNPACRAAVKTSRVPYFVYIHCPSEEEPWSPGGASLVWLHHSLKALGASLEKLGGRLRIFRVGEGEAFQSTKECLEAIILQTKARSLFWNRRYEPAVITRDKELKAHFRQSLADVETFNGTLLKEPWEVRTKEGKPFQVFTPFWKACLNQMDLDPPSPAPGRLPLPQPLHRLEGECDLEDLNLLPSIPWDGGIKESWQPGEAGARKQLATFLQIGLHDYASMRDRPDREGVSRMSPHLHFGEISARLIWYEVKNFVSANPRSAEAALCYLRELGWREFSHHLLYHFPQTTDCPLRKDFEAFPWQKNEKALRAWQRGMTGYPIVDAGMRELWHTGIMHNRVRMIVASFLVKHLLLPWQDGARWFWDTLVDADLAQNSLGWQWSAGCGADAAPYFRIFNPILQGEKFDPEGLYVRKWVPELTKLPTKYIHKPWEAPPEILKDSGIAFGDNYPDPIVDHGQARMKALEAFQKIRAPKP